MHQLNLCQQPEKSEQEAGSGQVRERNYSGWALTSRRKKGDPDSPPWGQPQERGLSLLLPVPPPHHLNLGVG